MKVLLQSLRVLAAFTVLTGLLYPLAVWAAGHALFHTAAEGSLVFRHGRLVGSALLAQKTASPRYFAPRPSAGDYATVASGASNQAWTNTQLATAIAARRAAWGGGEVPAELLTGSGSGLDPHLSLAAVRFQASRVAEARGLSVSQQHALDELIAAKTEGGQFGDAYLNVLELNLALDEAFPSP